MISVLSLLVVAAISADHEANPVFRGMIADGLSVNGTKVEIPPPTLGDGLDAEASKKALLSVVGDERAMTEFLRDSVSAPFILKTRDIKAGDATVRVADLWFAVHARLEEVDLDRALQSTDDQTIEVANMRVESKRLGDRDLDGRRIDRAAPIENGKEWFTHIKGRLLDRIVVETTDRAVVTRSPDSIVIASKTEHAFDNDPRLDNRWSSLTRKGSQETEGPRRDFIGSASYVRVTRLASDPGIVIVESHFVYVEPQGWFQGNPILRSKFGLIAQDQIRRLRREIEKKRNSK